MHLPFQPEPLQSLRESYPQALESPFDVESVRMGLAALPGSNHANVFDCEDGLRLIVSRERLIHGGMVLHFSASIHEGTAVFEKLRHKNYSRRQLLKVIKRIARKRFLEISGETRRPVFLFWTENFIPHWVIEENVDGNSQGSTVGRSGAGTGR